MAPTAPSPSIWTLRLKYHKSTTLLHVDPLQTFDSIKEELLRALKQTHPTGHLPTGVAIPSAPSELILGEPVDVHDLSLGWKRLESELDALGDDLGGDTKSSGKKKKGRSALREDCPSAAGLKDGGVLAYKFQSEEPAATGIPGVDDDEEGEWDVVIPEYDDAGEPKTDSGAS